VSNGGTVQDLIQRAIETKAKSMLRKIDIDHYYHRSYRRKFLKRTASNAPKVKNEYPWYWEQYPLFDPRHCLSRSKFYAKVIWAKFQDRTYEPAPAIELSIPKEAGGTREIMVFSIIDTAVASLFHRRLTQKNINIFSPYSFSFRPDKSIYDAIIQIKSFISDDKTYIVQYDFSKYFDTIDHNYLSKIIDEKKYFFTTQIEKFLLKKFMTHLYLKQCRIGPPQILQKKRGVPQGCSLSLFLSNIAAHELDKRLEQQNGQFVRFADDVLCATKNHDDALLVADEFKAHCERSGVRINFDKSPGIEKLKSLVPSQERTFYLNDGEGHDLRHIDHFSYLGHKISKNHIDLTDKAIRKIKRKISKIIYIHLLLNPKRGLFSKSRVNVSAHDWDLVTCINEIRKYVYGKLKHEQLVNFIDHNKKIKTIQGLMSFYVLVDRVDQLSKLDGWLVNILSRALRERRRHLIKLGVKSYTTPTRSHLIDGSWYKDTRTPNETKLPSFVLAWRCARKYLYRYGFQDIREPDYYSLLSSYT
jgi:RNA-directed DNA polymerase